MARRSSPWQKNIIFAQGESSDAVFYVQKGKVRLTDHPHGTQILRFLGSGPLPRVPPPSGVVQKLPDPAPNAANQPKTFVEARYVLACANSLTTSNSGVQPERRCVIKFGFSRRLLGSQGFATEVRLSATSLSDAGVPGIASFGRRGAQTLAETLQTVGDRQVGNEFHALVAELPGEPQA